MERSYYINKIEDLIKQFPAVCLLGPRQVGKTTLTKHFLKNDGANYSQIHIFDLEKAEDIEALNQPYLALKNLKGLIITGLWPISPF